MSEENNLERIGNHLRSHAGDQSTGVAIAIETGEDEAILIGTRDDFLKLASDLVAMVASNDAGALQSRKVGEVLARSTTSLKAFDRRASVIPTCVFVVDSEDEKKQIIDTLEQ